MRLLLLLLGLVAAASAWAETPAVAVKEWDLDRNPKRYSQGNEERIIRHFFGDRRGGFFVDLGCFHWRQYSTTYVLEKNLGWSGIGIDALDWVRDGYEKHRKKTRFYHYAVTDESGGTITFYADGAVSTTDGSRLAAFPKAENTQVLEVPTITLDDLLDQAEVKKIDFLSIDIEGGEATALKGFEIGRFKPELVCIEVAPENREAVAKYFADNGYTLLERYREYDPVNYYYARLPSID